MKDFDGIAFNMNNHRVKTCRKSNNSFFFFSFFLLIGESNFMKKKKVYTMYTRNQKQKGADTQEI